MNIVKANETMTSIDLREVINSARKEFGENPVRNTDFIKRIEDELEGELGVCEIFVHPQSGVKMRYYDLTLEQCLLVGMRESKSVRRNVLATLKQLEQSISAPTPTEPTPLQRATSDMEQWKAAAAIFEVPVSVALVEGVKHVALSYDIDFQPLLIASPLMDDIQDDEVMLEPTELGEELGYTAQQINGLLSAAGLQTKKGKQWVPTGAAKGYCSKHFWQSRNSTKSGYNLKWNLEFVRKQLGV